MKLWELSKAKEYKEKSSGYKWRWSNFSNDWEVFGPCRSIIFYYCKYSWSEIEQMEFQEWI